MIAFKLFDESKLKRNENIDEVITTWLNEKDKFKIIQINQSNDSDGYLLISFFYSTSQPHHNT
jgi:hypothetical protein